MTPTLKWRLFTISTYVFTALLMHPPLIRRHHFLLENDKRKYEEKITAGNLLSFQVSCTLAKCLMSDALHCQTQIPNVCRGNWIPQAWAGSELTTRCSLTTVPSENATTFWFLGLRTCKTISTLPVCTPILKCSRSFGRPDSLSLAVLLSKSKAMFAISMPWFLFGSGNPKTQIEQRYYPETSHSSSLTYQTIHELNQEIK